MSEIYVSINDENVGPFSVKDLNKKISAGDFTDNDMAWFEGMDDWLPLKDKEFKEFKRKNRRRRRPKSQKRTPARLDPVCAVMAGKIDT